MERICRLCLVLRFGWQWEIVEKWLGRQAESWKRINTRKAALELWRHHEDPSGVIRYAESYGV